MTAISPFMSIVLMLTLAAVVNVCTAGPVLQGTPKDDTAIAVVQHQVPILNRFTFQGSVRNKAYDATEEYVIYFCVSWIELCEALRHEYGQIAYRFEEQLNIDLFFNTVRFAYVDCATDKKLCNEEGVDDYPYAVHYRAGNLMSRWVSGQGSRKEINETMHAFIEQALSKTPLGGQRNKVKVVEPFFPTFSCKGLPLADAVKLAAVLSFAASAAGVALRALASGGGVGGGAWTRAAGKGTGRPSEDEALLSPLRCLPSEWGTERQSITL